MNAIGCCLVDEGRILGGNSTVSDNMAAQRPLTLRRRLLSACTRAPVIPVRTKSYPKSWAERAWSAQFHGPRLGRMPSFRTSRKSHQSLVLGRDSVCSFCVETYHQVMEQYDQRGLLVPPKRPCLWFRRIYPLLDGVSDTDPAGVNYYSLWTDWNSLYVKGGCDVHVYPGKDTKGSMSWSVH